MDRFMGDWKKRLATVLPREQLRFEEPMAAHCSFHAGGAAGALVQVKTLEELREVRKILQEENTEYYMLGRGTNLLVGDQGYPGVVITMTDPAQSSVTDACEEAQVPFVQDDGVKDWLTACHEKNEDPVTEHLLLPSLHAVAVWGEYILAGAGASLSRVAAAARENSLGGFAFAAGIPGSVGGALVMNAGAYEGEMRQVVCGALLLQEDGEIVWYTNEELHFGYRHSILKEQNLMAVQAVYRLQPASSASIAEEMEELAQKRRSKQPLEYGSAGSTFKRPEGHFAGKLIMDAGLAGFHIGDAAVSEKHCGFVVNKGQASATQLRQVISEVQRRVKETSGVELQREVIYLGE